MKKAEAILKITISGYYGFKNTGDEAILISMIKKIKGRKPQAEITVLSQNPFETSINYRVKAINRMHWLKILKCFSQTDIFLSGGGGLFQDVTGRGLSVLYYLGLILLAKIVGLPVMVYAQGIGPIKNQCNKILMKWILNKIDLISVRDNQSKKLLNQLEINATPIHVCGDPSFLLEKKAIDEKLRNIIGLKEILSENNSMLVGISVRSHKTNNKDSKKIFARLADTLISKHKSKIIFIPFNAKEDISESTEIMELMERREETYILRERLEPEELLSLISRFSFMLGMRLHSIMFSCLVQIPFIAISYDPKVKNFMEELDMSELALELNDLSLKKLEKKVEYLIEHHQDISKLLPGKVKILKEKANKNNELLFQLLESCQGGSFSIND